MFWRVEPQSNLNLFVAGQAVLQTSLLCEALSDAIRPLTPPIPPSKLVCPAGRRAEPRNTTSRGLFHAQRQCHLPEESWISPTQYLSSASNVLQVRGHSFRAGCPEKVVRGEISDQIREIQSDDRQDILDKVSANYPELGQGVRDLVLCPDVLYEVMPRASCYMVAVGHRVASHRDEIVRPRGGVQGQVLSWEFTGPELQVYQQASIASVHGGLVCAEP